MKAPNHSSKPVMVDVSNGKIIEADQDEMYMMEAGNVSQSHPVPASFKPRSDMHTGNVSDDMHYPSKNLRDIVIDQNHSGYSDIENFEVERKSSDFFCAAPKTSEFFCDIRAEQSKMIKHSPSGKQTKKSQRTEVSKAHEEGKDKKKAASNEMNSEETQRSTKHDRAEQTKKKAGRKDTTNSTEDSVKTALSVSPHTHKSDSATTATGASTHTGNEGGKYSFCRDGKTDCSIYELKFNDNNDMGSDWDPYDIHPKENQELDMKKLEAYFSETNVSSHKPARRKKSATSITCRSTTSVKHRNLSSRPKQRVSKMFSRRKRASQETERQSASKNSGIGILSLLRGKKDKKSSVKQ